MDPENVSVDVRWLQRASVTFTRWRVNKGLELHGC